MKLQFTKNIIKLLAVIGLISGGIFAQNNQRNDLSAKRWELTEISSRRVYSSKAFLEIAPPESRFSGNAGCNRMFGEVNINGRNINFGSVGATRMFCSDNGVMKLEADFIRALEKVTRYEKNGNMLKLYARNRLILKFKGAETSNSDDNSSVKLENKKWVLDSVKNRRLPKIESKPFINFDKEKGGAGGFTGCNSFGGNYTVNGETLRIFDIISTMRACIEDDRMNVERDFKDGLDKANRFKIFQDKLNLYQDKTLLLTFRAENK
jgi:heat shock protein HslJ